MLVNDGHLTATFVELKTCHNLQLYFSGVPFWETEGVVGSVSGLSTRTARPAVVAPASALAAKSLPRPSSQPARASVPAKTRTAPAPAHTPPAGCCRTSAGRPS